MKKILFILVSCWAISGCAPILIGGALVTGVNVAHDRRSSGQVLDDKIIQSSVKNEIRKQVEDDTRIKVDSFNGVVLLAGEVVNSNDRVRAEDAAAIKDGVKKVVNQLKTVDEVSKMGRRVKDNYLMSKAKGSLMKIDLPGFDLTRVNLTVANGEVFLMGLVSQEEADAVVENIRHLRGVYRVVKVFEYTN